MNKAHFYPAHLLAVFLVAASTAVAQVEGPGGHYYKAVIDPGLSWEEAKTKAAESTFNGVHGHLATIASAEEDAFIESLRQEAAPGGYGSLWIGGSQLPSATSPTDGWFWVNGEGAIPTQNGGPVYANWQPAEPNDYWGPQSESFLSTGHFNNFGWNDEPNDRHIYGYVVEYPGRGTAATVSVTATDPSAIENGANQGPPDGATFQFSRAGDLSLDLPVFYSIHGTASNGADYNEISRSIIIPAGESAVRLDIVPRPDALTVVEPMETVGIRLEPSLILTPSAGYNMDPGHREAAVVIYENRPPERGAIEIGVPGDGFVYPPGESVTILAAVYSLEPITTVNFYADNVKIGSTSRTADSGGLSFFNFTWNNPSVGSHVVTARVTAPDGTQLTSSSIRISIQESPETPRVAIRFVAAQGNEPWPYADIAPGSLEVSRTGSTAQNLQVFYSVTGTATADVDYEGLQGYVVVGAGRSTARITVVAKDDWVDEPNETVIVSLVPAVPANPVDPSDYVIDPEHHSAEVIILDNDEPSDLPTVSINAVTAHTSELVSNAGATPGLFRISRTGPATASVTVSLSYEGTATPGVDYR
jgi:hypothetical protein